ncbi:hypothetical protein Taro_051993 [Colocasia esculenta]|uniref:Uncharacterized protein n=1 Tax=Colocasia esculenta TaxID=4460 RepID=A0A843XHE8_COLES|nr:hypothetical protein [Colocasia esculenta]
MLQGNLQLHIMPRDINGYHFLLLNSRIIKDLVTSPIYAGIKVNTVIIMPNQSNDPSKYGSQNKLDQQAEMSCSKKLEMDSCHWLCKTRNDGEQRTQASVSPKTSLINKLRSLAAIHCKWIQDIGCASQEMIGEHR